jgi:hypothetical protein
VLHDELAVGDDRTVREIHELREVTEPHPAPNLSTHPAFARGSRPAIVATTERLAVAAPSRRSAGEIIARVLYFVSGALIAAAVALYGGQIWRGARDRSAPAAAPVPVPAMAVIAASGRVELSADRRGVTRLAGAGPHWSAAQPVALDAIAVTGPVVLGRTPDAIVALDLESGRTRFTWTPPGDERWAVVPPVALGSCLVALTVRAHKTIMRCLDLATGTARWTASPAGARDCTQPPVQLPGAYFLSCAGWTAVIDERTGTIGVDAGGVSLVQSDPPYLLRAGSRLALAPWSASRRRFTSSGELGYPAGGATVSSAVLYKDRLVIRANESSDELAIIASRDAPPIPIAAPVYRLAGAAPLVRSCGGTGAPRFQLLELAPRIGASFDPATASDRALALLDVERGTLAWTSRKIGGQPRGGQPMICRGGHYLVPLEVPDRTGAPTSALWVLDAETGKTTAAVAPDPELETSFVHLTAEQLDDDRVVGVGRGGAFDLRWQPVSPGLHDARRELEAALGALP